jgi:hypothetical protein
MRSPSSGEVMLKPSKGLRMLTAICSGDEVWLRVKACGWVIIQRCYDSYSANVCNFFFLCDVEGGNDKGLRLFDQRFPEESLFVGSDAISPQPRQTKTRNHAQIHKRGS